MEKKAIVVCTIVGILGLISAIAGFAAEATRIKASDVTAYDYECVYPSSPSMGLGIGAAVALALARFILSTTGGGTGSSACCRSATSTISRPARLCCILSWLASVVAMFLLLSGVAIASKQGGETMNSDGTIIRCYSLRPGVFAGGAIMAILGLLLGTIFYLTIFSSNSSPSAAKHGGAANHDIEVPPIAPPVKAVGRSATATHAH